MICEQDTSFADLGLTYLPRVGELKGSRSGVCCSSFALSVPRAGRHWGPSSQRSESQFLRTPFWCSGASPLCMRDGGSGSRGGATWWFALWWDRAEKRRRRCWRVDPGRWEATVPLTHAREWRPLALLVGRVVSVVQQHLACLPGPAEGASVRPACIAGSQAASRQR